MKVDFYRRKSNEASRGTALRIEGGTCFSRSHPIPSVTEEVTAIKGGRHVRARGARAQNGNEGRDSDNEVYLNANASGLIKQLAFEGRRR